MTVLDPELFLPDPQPREVKYTVISVDDHVVEPPHLFETYLPAKLRSKGPQIVEAANGAQVWEFEEAIYSQVGMNAVAGRRQETVKIEPFRFDQMRPGCYDVHARVADMDLGGIWAMLNFPSMITGFCGRVFAHAKDVEVGKAAVKAWNDWLWTEWFQAYPDRIIPCGIVYLSDPTAAADEIRRNAARGFTSVTLPERPHAVGLPNLWDRTTGSPSSRPASKPTPSSRCTSAVQAVIRRPTGRPCFNSDRRCSGNSHWQPAPNGYGPAIRWTIRLSRSR